MSQYTQILYAVAENPGVEVESLTEIADDVDGVNELLETAVERGDVVRFNGRHWVVRKGEFAYHEYDHPETTSET